MQERWFRWTLEVKWSTSGYLVREEIKKDKFQLRRGKRAVKFEMKMEEGRDGMLARKC